MHRQTDKIKRLWGRYRYAALVFLVGVLLLVLPSAKQSAASDDSTSASAQTQTNSAADETARAESRLAALLTQIDGAGEVHVLLSYTCSAETEYVDDNGETVIVSAGSGTQTALTRKTVYPQYLGAVVVCAGADSAQVRLDVLQAVEQFTGLASDRISVLRLRADAESK